MTVLFLGVSVLGQSTRDVVYMKSGAVYHGKVRSLSPEIILIETEEHTIALDANELLTIERASVHVEEKWTERAKDASETQSASKRKPLDRKTLFEMRGGAFVLEPLGIDLSMGLINNIGSRWALGVSTGLRVSQWSIFGGALELRRYFSDPDFTRFYLSFRPGISFVPNQRNAFSSSFKSTPVKSLGLFSGCLLDSGYGIAMSCNFGLNYTWFKEYYYLSEQQTEIRHYGLGPEVSLSLIF